MPKASTTQRNLRKAFDKVNWGFFGNMLEGLGWLGYGMTFSIFLNGGMHGYFPGNKGLRQGQPLFYLPSALSIYHVSFVEKRPTLITISTLHVKRIGITYHAEQDPL